MGWLCKDRLSSAVDLRPTVLLIVHVTISAAGKHYRTDLRSVLNLLVSLSQTGCLRAETESSDWLKGSLTRLRAQRISQWEHRRIVHPKLFHEPLVDYCATGCVCVRTRRLSTAPARGFCFSTLRSAVR